MRERWIKPRSVRSLVFKAFSAIGIAASLSVPSTPANAQERRTTRQLERLTPGAANRVIQDDLLSVLEPSGRISAGNRLQLRGVELSTRSYGTAYEGVCRRDAITLRYMAATSAEPTRDAPVRPYGIEAQPMFHIVLLPDVTDDIGHYAEPLAGQKGCANLDDGRYRIANVDADADDQEKRAVWFSARDAFEAVQAGFVVDRAIAAVKAGTLKPEPCPEINRPAENSCEHEIFATGGFSAMRSVETCATQAGSLCYRIEFDGIALTIIARGDDKNPIPSSIVSIAVEGFIIVT